MKVNLKLDRDARVLLLEDTEERITWFKERIYNLTVAKTSADAIITLVATSEPFDVVFLDHDLGRVDTGQPVARHLEASGFLGKNVVIHSWNTDGAAIMADCLRGATIIPFGQFEISLI